MMLVMVFFDSIMLLRMFCFVVMFCGGVCLKFFDGVEFGILRLVSDI